MTEARITFLCKAAAMLPGAKVNKTQEMLKSYYMMRCKELSKGYGLPQKYFSEKARCSHCCLEWNNKAEIKVRPIKLTKRQRRRIREQRNSNKGVNKEHLLHSNEIEQICAFCKHSTKTVIAKPNKDIIEKPHQPVVKIETKKKINEKLDKKIKELSSVYSNTAQVFSLNNKKNILKATVKEEPKIIKNSKKKKDKFAGLCQKAVLASAKLKHENRKQNKLSLFLKPSS